MTHSIGVCSTVDTFRMCQKIILVVDTCISSESVVGCVREGIYVFVCEWHVQWERVWGGTKINSTVGRRLCKWFCE